MNDSFPEMASKAGDGDMRAAAGMLRLLRDWMLTVSMGSGCPEEASNYFSSIASECARASAFCDGFDAASRAISKGNIPPPPQRHGVIGGVPRP